MNPNRRRSPYEQYINLQAMSVLEIVGFCQEFHRLPKEGGILDQDSLFIHLLRRVLHFQQEKQKLDQRKSASSRV